MNCVCVYVCFCVKLDCQKISRPGKFLHITQQKRRMILYALNFSMPSSLCLDSFPCLDVNLSKQSHLAPTVDVVETSVEQRLQNCQVSYLLDIGKQQTGKLQEIGFHRSLFTIVAQDQTALTHSKARGFFENLLIKNVQKIYVKYIFYQMACFTEIISFSSNRQASSFSTLNINIMSVRNYLNGNRITSNNWFYKPNNQLVFLSYQLH